MSTIVIHLDWNPKWNQALGYWGLVACILAICPLDIGSESLTLQTYYPSPLGIYTNMTTTGQTLLARDGGNVGIGTGSTTPSARLHVIAPGTWDHEPIRAQSDSTFFSGADATGAARFAINNDGPGISAAGATVASTQLNMYGNNGTGPDSNQWFKFLSVDDSVNGTRNLILQPDRSGHVLIGATDDHGYMLDVNGGIKSRAYIQAVGSIESSQHVSAPAIYAQGFQGDMYGSCVLATSYMDYVDHGNAGTPPTTDCSSVLANSYATWVPGYRYYGDNLWYMPMTQVGVGSAQQRVWVSPYTDGGAAHWDVLASSDNGGAALFYCCPY